MGNIVFFFQLDLLDSGDPSIGGIPDLVMFAIAPSCVAILYLNHYHPNQRWSISLLFTGLSLFFEYLLATVGFLTYKRWRIWYSIPFYFLFYLVFLSWHLQFIRGEERLPFSWPAKTLSLRKEKAR